MQTWGSGASPVPDRKPTILHADDDEANRYAVTRSLLKAGFDVTEASDGATALARLADHPDLVILDVRLPDMDGFEVCRRIKADPATAAIPVLHLSASMVSGKAKAQGLDGGADGYLIRPVEPVELVATVNALLRTKRVEAELRASREQLRDALETAERARADAELAGRMKDEFLANLSHELRTPLNAILGWATLLTPDADEADLRDGLETIRRNARAQTKIIEDLLDMSRIVGGKVRLDVRPTDVAAIVREAADTVRPAADAKGVTVELHADPAVGPIPADPDRLQQVLWNLLNNAIKFTPRGGRVTVTVRHLHSHLDVSVTDTGQGIPPAFLPYVFDRFRQVDGSTTRRHGGLGLGLAISKQLVELHGGSVGVVSPGVGAGATFTITLPIAGTTHQVADRAGPATPPARPSPAARPRDLTDVRILVVDDEPDARDMVRRVLQGHGATVAAAGSADAAIDLLRAQPFHVLVSDIGMPGEDGYSLITRVRGLAPAENARVPAVALTAYARQSDQARALATGYQRHLAKPLEPTALLIAITALLGR
jgi:signal transduction histidine kinase